MCERKNDLTQMRIFSPFILAMVALFILFVFVMRHLLITGKSENVYPEIISFCLEGIFLVFIVALFQKRNTIKQAERAKKTLKDTLSHFIKDFVWWMSVGAVQDMNKLTTESNNKKFMVNFKEQAENALTALNEGKCIPPGLIEPVKRYGQKESIMLKCMLPVAVQVNETHLKTWFNLIRALDDIVESHDDKEINLASKYFLKQVITFSDLK